MFYEVLGGNMNKIFSKKIIQDFRDLMNEGFYGANNLSDVNGKNDWGLICSQMDWIQMWIEEIENISFNNKSKYRNKINITQFILGIDTIVTATKGLLDHFCIDYAELFKEKNIFKNKFYPNTTDYDYFRRLRTALAIHPTDIDPPDPNIKYYAGWVYVIGDEFNITLYNEDAGKENESLKVQRKELLLFANSWYKKIEDINLYLKPKVDEFIK